MIHVVASDLEHAIQRLETVITIDRIDVPATEKWRRLAMRIGATSPPTPLPGQAIELPGLGH